LSAPITVSRRFAARAALAATAAFASIPASAQQAASRLPTFDDLRQALIWTGHYDGFAAGDRGALTHAALHDWQKSKNYPQSDSPANEQVLELIAEAAKKSAPFGWSVLRDRYIGFSIGIPTKLVKFVGTRNAGSALWYDFDAAIGYSIGLQYNMPTCATFDRYYAALLQSTNARYHVRQDNWFVLGHEKSGRISYSKFLCSPAGALVVDLSAERSQYDTQGIVLAAIADSVRLERNFDPTSSPHPKIDTPVEVPPIEAPPGGMLDAGKVAQPHIEARLAAGIDHSGKTDAVKREAWNGTELRTEEVFAKAGAAVYSVKAGKVLGSAVAVSEHELLTNCHVVGNSTQVALKHDKLELKADVVSGDVAADRCVLRSPTALASFVRVSGSCRR